MTPARDLVKQWNAVSWLSWYELVRFLSVAERRHYWFSRQIGNFRRRMLAYGQDAEDRE